MTQWKGDIVWLCGIALVEGKEGEREGERDKENEREYGHRNVETNGLFFAGALNATHGSYFGNSGLPTVMAYTNCFGQENQLANCTGFQYSPYVPQWYCSDRTIAGVMCISEIINKSREDFVTVFCIGCTYMPFICT